VEDGRLKQTPNPFAVNPRDAAFSQVFLAYIRKHHPNWILPNQPRGREQKELWSNCTPRSVNIMLCDIPLSIEELMTYFPLHLWWDGMAVRCYNHNWSDPQNICDYIYWSRQLKHSLSLEPEIVLEQLEAAMSYGNKDSDVNMIAILASPSEFAGRRMDPLVALHDYCLVDLAEGVHHHPEH
jgi:hypothetical protein